MNLKIIIFWIYLSIIQSSEECYESCESCTQKGNEEAHNCITCKNEYYQLDDSSNCYQIGHPNYYFESSSKKIRKCPSPCYECKYLTTLYCINCLPGYEYNSQNNECYKCNNSDYKYIYNKYDSCESELNSKFCKKFETKCIDDNTFEECPYEIPFYFAGNKTCTLLEFTNDNSGNNYEILNDKFKNEKINNFFIISKSQDEINYSSISFIIDNEDNSLIIQVEDFYFDQIMLYKINKEGKQTIFKSIQSTTSFYGEESIIIDINNNKYILNINKYEFSIIDFQNDIIKKSSFETMTNINSLNLESYKNVLISINKNSGTKAYLFGFINEVNFELIYYTFKSNDISETNNYIFEKKIFRSIPFLKMVSCFQTKENIIECLYINNKYQIEVIVLSENFQLLESIIINDNVTDINYHYFNKAILHKDEIGIYIYCSHYLEIKKLIKNHNTNRYILKNYIPYITDNYIDIQTNNVNANEMDLIKLAGDNFALIEISEINSYIVFITIFTLYNNDKYLKMRTYKLNFKIYSSNYEFFDMLKGFNFNNYLGFGYSIKTPASSGFIIIGYCNATDPPFISDLFETNPGYELKLSNYFIIDNNIFSNILYGFKILSLPDENSGIFIASKNTKNKIFKNDILVNDDSIIFGFSKSLIKKGEYKIEFSGITSQQTNYELMENSLYYSKYYGKEDIKEFYKPQKFLGKMVQFNFSILNDNNFNCQADCASCLYENNNKCLTCESNSKKLAEDLNTCHNALPVNNYFFNNKKNMFMKCHSFCQTCSNGPIYEINTYDDLINSNCDICKNNYIKKGLNNCIENKNCNNVYYIQNNKMNCFDNSEKCPEDYPFLNTLTKECLTSCSGLDINICINTHKIKYTFEEFLNEIRNMIKNDTINTILEESENGKFIIQNDNITYEVTYTNNTLFNISLSKIDLGECEYILKDIYDIDEEKELIMLKIDIYYPDKLSPLVQYEVYHPDTKEILNLTFCSNYSVDIEVPTQVNEAKLYIVSN